MRNKLIIACGFFSLVGVIADQLAFHTDDLISSSQQEREVSIEQLQTVGTLYVENNLLIQKLVTHLSRSENLPDALWQIAKYDFNYLCDYAQENVEWFENEEYSQVIALNDAAIERICISAKKIFQKDNIYLAEQIQILEFFSELNSGLLKEIINWDLEIFWLLEYEIQKERDRQILLLIAIISSLFSILSVLIFFRKYSSL